MRYPQHARPYQEFPRDNVWAAAAAAYRINGEYLKEDRSETNTEGLVVVSKRRNFTVMKDVLREQSFTEADIERGREIRELVEQRLTFNTLTGRALSQFDQNILDATARDTFAMPRDAMTLGLIAFVPEYVARAVRRDNADSTISEARSEPVGKVGERVDIQLTIVDCTFSAKYLIYFCRAVDAQNRAVRFSYKHQMSAGTDLKLRGTVTDYNEGITRLNRVKVL